MSTPGQNPTFPTAELTLLVESDSDTPEKYCTKFDLMIGRASPNIIVIDHPDTNLTSEDAAVEQNWTLVLPYKT